MKLDYGTLLSYEPLQLHCGCRIKSPTLKEISEIGFSSYDSFLSLLLMDISTYFHMIGNETMDYFLNYDEEDQRLILQIKDEYENLPDKEKKVLSFIDIASYDHLLLDSISDALSFFLDSKVNYLHNDPMFAVYDKNTEDDTPSGYIPNRIYAEVVNYILQRNGISKGTAIPDDRTKVKNKTALKILQKLDKARAEKTGTRKSDQRMELPNIISAVSAYHKSINMTNIWELTVYQLYDLFSRMQQNNVFDIQMMSVAAWGNSNNTFDVAGWFEYGKY